jgi:hypothetical protein
MSLTRFIQAIEQGLIPESIPLRNVEIKLSEPDTTQYRYYDPETSTKITEQGKNLEEKLNYSLELVRQGLVFTNQTVTPKKPVHSCSTLLCTPRGLGGVISTYFDIDDLKESQINDSLLIIPKNDKKLYGRDIDHYPINNNFLISYPSDANLDKKVTELLADEIIIRDPNLDSIPDIPKRLIRLYNSFTYRKLDLGS